MKADKWDYGPDQMLMKGSGLPKAKTDPVVKILFFLRGCVKCETVRAGLFHWLARVHALVKDEECERASLLIRGVGGDFVHIGLLLGFIPIFPLPPLPQFF